MVGSFSVRDQQHEFLANSCDLPLTMVLHAARLNLADPPKEQEKYKSPALNDTKNSFPHAEKE